MWRCADHTFDLVTPLVMGVVNVSPDSFSRQRYSGFLKEAIEHGRQLVVQGADIIDVGGESTRPGFISVDPQEELSRVIPVVKELVACGGVVSIDTRHALVAAAAIDAGASVVNDVTGFSSPDMHEVARSYDVGLVAVRSNITSHQVPPVLPYQEDDSPAFSLKNATEALARLSPAIDTSRVVFDPGFGFVDTYEEDLALWAHLDQLASLSCPLLVGVSRKRLIGRISGIPDPLQRDEPSAQLAFAATEHGAKVVRTHNVALTKRYLSGGEEPAIVTAYVALGSNLGDRKVSLDEATVRIDALPLTQVVARSADIETAAQYVTNQPDFLNGVLRVETRLPLFAFFTELQAIEIALGRVKEYDKGPRNIDLDLLFYGDVVYLTKELAVPHPLINERDFVLTPLREVRV